MTPIERLFERLPELPTIPAVVQELIASLGRDDVELGGLIAKVREDQALSARVLRLANSPYYAGRKSVGSIEDAVAMIGLNALRAIVIASGVAGAITKVEGIRLPDFWKHSQLTARLAGSLGKLAGLNKEFAYAAGLLHRIGQLLIQIVVPEIGNKVQAECKNLSVGELAALERLHLTFDHSQVSAELARKWFFPEDIVGALAFYTRPEHEGACPYAGVVNLAASIAFGIEKGLPDEVILSHINRRVVAQLGLDEVDWPTELAKMREAAGAGETLYA